MAKKITRDAWSAGEFADMVALKEKTGMRAREIARTLRKKYGTKRTESSVNTAYSKVTTGIIGRPDISKIRTEELTTMERHERNEWTDTQNERLYELLVTRGLNNQETAETMNREFGTNRKSASISTQYNTLKNYALKRPESIKDAHFPDRRADFSNTETKRTPLILDISTALQQYDREYLRETLEKRKRLIYELMEKQANLIRSSGVLSKHGEINLKELMTLSSEERSKTAKLLIAGTYSSESEINKIDLLSIPYFINGKSGIALILPVFVQDVAIATSKTLESCLDSAVVQAVANREIASKAGFNQGTPFEDRFGALRRYNLIAKVGADYSGFARNITMALSMEYKDKEVRIIEDLGLSNSQLKAD